MTVALNEFKEFDSTGESATDRVPFAVVAELVEDIAL
jgi:hypothetical protein